MERHELVDKEGNKTGKILTHIEVRDSNNMILEVLTKMEWK